MLHETMGKRNKQQMKAAAAAKNNQENENDIGKYCSFCYLLKKENNKHYLWLVNKNKNLKTVEKHNKDTKNGFGHEEDENRLVVLELSEPYEKDTRLFTQKEFLDEFNQCASVLPDFQAPHVPKCIYISRYSHLSI